jgi:hypothetical protein
MCWPIEEQGRRDWGGRLPVLIEAELAYGVALRAGPRLSSLSAVYESCSKPMPLRGHLRSKRFVSFGHGSIKSRI